tara:strand:- start:1227 stop:1643 length:417 start_codon:yes stop_codon:yes gene_type:complete
MASMHTTFTASGTFTLTDANGVVIFTYNPSFTTLPNTAANALYSGEHLVATGGSEIANPATNDDRAYLFIKNIDTDYPVELDLTEQEGTSKEIADIKPGEFFFAPVELNSDDSGNKITVTAVTAAQKVQYLIADAIDN